jgi:hypothetical protein
MSVEAGSSFARADVAQAVAADLDAIFASVSAETRGPSRARSLTVIPGRGPARPRRLQLASLGAIASAALVGLAAGTFVPSTPSRAPTVAQSPLPDPNPPFVPPVQAAVLPQPTSPAQPEVRAEPAVERRAAAPRPRATKAKSRSCARARCSRSEVMDADVRLRSAYFRAVRAGVPRPVLVQYRNRWAQLRVNARHEPQRLVTGYRSLATGLAREARRS